MSIDGDCYAMLYGFTAGVTYYFKIVSYDNSYNESEASNTATVTIPPPLNNENMYFTQGDLFSGITLDANNRNSGTMPEGFTLYDESDYDAGTYGVTAIYESHLLYNIAAIRTYGGADTENDIQVQYRIYENGSFGAWSEVTNAVGYTNIVTGGNTVQVRFIFNSPTLTDDDYIYISQVEVA
jgi:hypothetical protein